MKYIKISSVKKSKGTPYDFNLNFSSPILQGVYKLKNIVIPNSYYTINPNNFNIYFSEDNSSNVITAQISPYGFYDATTITSTIKSALDNASLVYGSNKTYTVSLNSVTNKLTITCNTGTFAFKFGTKNTNSASTILGINKDTSFLSSITAENAFNLNNILSFNIQFNDYSVENLLIEPSSGYFYSFSVPITVNSNEIQTTEFLQDYYVEFNNNTRTLNVKILDDNGYPIYLQNDWYMLLEKCG